MELCDFVSVKLRTQIDKCTQMQIDSILALAPDARHAAKLLISLEPY